MLNRILQGDLNLGEILAWLIAVTVAITVHEFGHALSAEKAGDPTPRSQGRVTLNPLAHYDPVGSTLFLLFGFGWAKPVPVNPLAFRNPRWDGALVAFWGPLANFITASILALPVRLGLTGEYTHALVFLIYANLMLGFFNLLPLGPLDGSHVLEGLLPDRARRRWQMFTQRYHGLLMIMILVIMVVPLANMLVFGLLRIPVMIMLKLLLGGVGTL